MSRPEPAESSGVMDPRIYYLVPEDQGGRVDIIGLFAELWRRKWILLGVGILFALVGVVYSLLATEWYRSETVVVPAGASAGLQPCANWSRPAPNWPGTGGATRFAVSAAPNTGCIAA